MPIYELGSVISIINLKYINTSIYNYGSPCLYVGGIFWVTEGFEVVSNYKFWDSISNSIIYDHPGYGNLLRYSTQISTKLIEAF
jgi:hypothetical protein